ncbi:MAG TPA: tetratricopeptide repeat protein [Bryobacteraceae bacterium]|nr:tetratricopeptide repeat protein [Bryobacteraceae bacterium]
MPYHALCQPANSYVPISVEASSSGTGVHHKKITDFCAGRVESSHRELAFVRAGRYGEARPGLERAIAVAEQTKSTDTAALGCLITAIGFVDIELGRPQEAADWYRRALQLAPLPDDLQALLTNNLANAYLDSLQLDRAEETARRAIRLYERAFGTASSELVFPQLLLASVYARRGEYAVAEPVYRRVLHSSERSWSASSYEATHAANVLASLYLAQGRHELARELFARALVGLRTPTVGTKDEVAVVQAALAATCAAGGRLREAEVYVQQALAAVQELGEESRLMPEILDRTVIALFYLKQYERAWQVFDRATRLIEVHQGSEAHMVRFDAYSRLARAVKDKLWAKQIEARRKAFNSKG